MFSVSAAIVCSPSLIFVVRSPRAVFLIEYNASATPSNGPVRRLALEDGLVRVLGRGTALTIRGAASKA